MLSFLKPARLAPENTTLWLGVAFVLKAIIFLFFFPYEIIEVNRIGLWSGDTDSYLSPINELLRSGNYLPDYRMPGYGVIYLVFRLFLSSIWAENSVIILQWVVSTISVYTLARAIFLMTQDTKFFLLVFFLYLVSTYVNVYDYYLLSESFTTSFLIFGFYFFVNFLRSQRFSDGFISGFFLTWMVFLRPVFLPVLFLFLVTLIVCVVKLRRPAGVSTQCVILFLLPFLISESIWLFRNYQRYERIVPLATSLYSPEIEKSYVRELMPFVIAWGGDRSWWNPEAEIRWFIDNSDMYGNYTKPLPSYIYTSAFNTDSLQTIRRDIKIIDSPLTDSSTKKNLTHQVKSKLRNYSHSIRKEKSFLFYVGSKFILFKKFFFHSGTQLLFKTRFEQLGIVRKTVKLFYISFYYGALISGVIGLILILVRWRNEPVGLILTCMLLLYCMIAFPVLGHIEYRYFLPAYPFLIVCSGYALRETLAIFKRFVSNK